MLSDGTRIIVGEKYARFCSYGHISGLHARIDGEGYELIDAYRLKGKHLFYYIKTDKDGSWEIHADDALPFANTNKDAVSLLDREW